MRIPLRALNPLVLTGLRRPPDAAPTPLDIESNIHHLVWEVTWYGMLMGMAINFMQVYVVRLGAPSLLVGAITYGPALICILWQLPATRLMDRCGWRMRWVLGGNFVYRILFMLIALFPFFTRNGLAELTVLVTVLQAIPQVIAATSFLSMLADAVSVDRMSAVLSGRMAGYGVTTTLATLAAGLILSRVSFPLNYQVLFTIGFLTVMIGQWHLSRLRVPDRSRSIVREGWLSDFRRAWRYPRFMRYVAAVGVQQTVVGMLAPLWPLFWVRRLAATDVQISLIVTIYSGIQVLGCLYARRLVWRLGRERILTLGTLGFGLYPFLASFSPSIWWLIPWAVLGGLFYAAISVTLFDNLVAVSPDEGRSSFMAIYNLFVNSALFIGPLLAALLVRGPGGPGLGLQVAAGISLCSGLLFARWLRPAARPGT